MTDFTFAHREEGFDNHIDMSIRHYSSLVDDIVSMSDYFVEEGTEVVDIGCSTGKMLDRIQRKTSGIENVIYNGIECAEGFFDDMEAREAKNPNLSLYKTDVRGYDFVNCSLVTSVFTLQFIPRRDRQNIIQNIYRGLESGGAFIFSEKLIAKNAKFQDMMTFQFYDHKRKNFDGNDILDKEVTLRSMLKPNTMDEIIDMLLNAGFKKDNIQTFWQNHLFVGFIALKD